MTIFKNEVSVSLMVWETVPQKRNANNLIKFVSTHQVEDGDKIIGQFGETGVSEYTITEITSTRPSTINNHAYYTATATWKSQPPMLYKNQDLTLTGEHFPEFIDEYVEPKKDEPKALKFK